VLLPDNSHVITSDILLAHYITKNIVDKHKVRGYIGLEFGIADVLSIISTKNVGPNFT
jgi:hypothetical protein